ncbi:MAG: tRNA dihydrouridine(20/20a) synthase DusA [Leptospiraceae bacterium]|nr:tRNA dihydrouridine(20/20a) synthase DusA [Leptospiraceae bacterium]
MKAMQIQRKRFSVAPMMDWTDRHYRYMARLLSARATLYTEMIHARAIIHGDRSRHLDFHASEHPLVLQLGGSDAAHLAEAARIGEDWGYDEINLNCGCPSDRVASGSFGACLMADPMHVGHLVRAMKDAVSVPVTVKCRIGIEGRGLASRTGYEDLLLFARKMQDSGCDGLIVHARIAVLGGLNPAQNREVPPLRYEDVYRLKEDMPGLRIEINGGIRSPQEIQTHLNGALDGVMVGRAAYERPALLCSVDSLVHEIAEGRSALRGGAAVMFSSPHSGPDNSNPELQEIDTGAPGFAVPTISPDRLEWVLDSMKEYILARYAEGVPPQRIVRHMLGLVHGLPGARLFRQGLSGNWQRNLNSAASLDRYLGSTFAVFCNQLREHQSSGSLILQP